MFSSDKKGIKIRMQKKEVTKELYSREYFNVISKIKNIKKKIDSYLKTLRK